MARTPEGWRLYIDKGTGIHIVRFTHAGRRWNLSTGERNRTRALARAQHIFLEKTTGKRRAATAGRAFRGEDIFKLCGRWLTQMQHERRAATVLLWEAYLTAHWSRIFTSPSELADVAALERYVDQRLREVTASTVKKECSAIQSFLHWAARPSVGLLAAAPKVPRPPKGAAGTSSKPKIQVPLSAAEAETIIEALPERLRDGRPCRALFRVIWETALRIGGVQALEAPGDYRLGASTLRIRDETDKAAYGRELPLTAAARAALDSVCPDEGLLFPRASYRYHLTRAAKAAGIPEHLAPHVSPHDFRHARLTHLLDMGGSLTGAAYLAGHKQVTTTNRYAHAKRRAAEEALALVDENTGQNTGQTAPENPPETTKPAEVAGSLEPSFLDVCGREDSNLHILSDTRSLV